MIVSLKGKIQELLINRLVLDVNGVGYECLITIKSYEELVNKKDQEVTILTYHHITDSSQSLFGFIDNKEKEIFKLLISVSGIGPKTGIQLLSSVSALELEERIKTGEVGLLTSIPGIGSKTAKRIIIELKEKFISLSDDEMPIEEASSDNSIYNDALDALIVLGYNKRDISVHLKNIINKNKMIEASELIRLALNKIGKR
jgi:Holliday junction DNA helicase RuvA